MSEYQENRISVAPVPASEYVTIDSPTKILKYELISPSGTILVSSMQNDHSAQINIRTLNSGFYLLRIQTTEGIAVKKIVKQ
jgi:hypothetical protein